MKRALFFLVFILLLGGIGAAWWFLRDTPDKVLREAIISVGSIKTIGNATLDAAWLDTESKATTGFTALAQVDLKDASKPNAMGVIRVAARSVTDQDQVFDFILDPEGIAFRPEELSPEWLGRFHELAGTTSSDPFISVNREAFFQTIGYSGALSQEKDAALRQLLPSLQPTVYATSDLEQGERGGRRVVSVQFRFLRDGFQPLLVALAKAWKGKVPLTARDYIFIDQVADNALAGDFRVTLDRETRQLVALEGNWPDVDSRIDSAKVRFTLDVDALNQRVQIAVPKSAINITAKVAPQTVPSALPSSVTKAGYVAPSSTGEYIVPVVEPRGIDAFSEYYDQLKKRGLIGGAKKKK